MASKQIRTEIILNGQDKLSPVANDAVNKTLGNLNRLEKRTSRISDNAFRAGRSFGVAGLALVAPLVAAGKEAIEFEKRMAAVGKVAGFQIGSQDFAKTSDQAKDLALYLGRDAELVAGLYDELASGGVALKDLQEVGVIAGEVGVAYDRAADEAGESFIKMRNALGTTIEETKLAADAINHLSDGMASKAGEILTFMSSGGAAVSRGFNIASQDVAAFGSTLISMGKSAEESSTILERMMKGIYDDDALRKVFTKAGGGIQGVQKVLADGVKIKDAEKQTKYFKAFGLYGVQVRNVALGLDGPGGLNEALELVSDTTKYAGSVHREFESQQKTTAIAVGKTKAQLQVLALEVGENLLPIIKETSEEIIPLVRDFGAWAKENPDLTKGLLKTAIALSGVSLAISGTTFLIGGYATAVGVASKALVLLAESSLAIKVMGAVSTNARLFQMLGVEALAVVGPIAAVASNMLLVGAALKVAYDNWAPFHHATERMFSGFSAFGNHIGEAKRALLAGDFEKLGRINDAANLEAEINADDSRKAWNAEKGIAPGASGSTLPNIFGANRMGYGGTRQDTGGSTSGSMLPVMPTSKSGAGGVILNVTLNASGGMTPADKNNYNNMTNQLKKIVSEAISDKERQSNRLTYKQK